MIETTSNFPDEIDTLGYHSDVTIGQQEIMDEYESLVAQNRYAEAYKLISESSIFGWFADYFNMLENRIYSTQVFLTNTLKVQHPDQNLYIDTVPTEFVDKNKTRELREGDTWISTSDIVTSDDYGTYSYNLSSPITLTGDSYLDTGMKLWTSYSQKWTVVIQFDFIEPESPDPWYVFSGVTDREYTTPYLMLRGSKSGNYVNLAMGKMYSNMGTVGGDTVDSNLYYNPSGLNTIILSRDGANYCLLANASETYYGYSTWGDPTAESEWTNFDTTFVVGGKWNSDGTEITNLTPLTIKRLTIYDDAFDRTKCISVYNSLNG